MLKFTSIWETQAVRGATYSDVGGLGWQRNWRRINAKLQVGMGGQKCDRGRCFSRGEPELREEVES